MSWEVPQWIADIARSQAKSVARTVETAMWREDDLYQEAMLYLASDPERWGRQVPDRTGTTYVRLSLFHFMRKLPLRDPERLTGSLEAEEVPPPRPGCVTIHQSRDNVSDRRPGRQRGGTFVIEYDFDELTTFLPGVWDDDVALRGARTDERPPDPDMPRGQGPNPAHGNQAAAKVADVSRAWLLTNLTLRQRRIILCRYGLGYTQRGTGMVLGVSVATVNRDEKQAITAMLDFLNG